jgi:exodeoxyribonuclease VII large subunit
MSPLKVLGRGYAIATRADGRAVRVASDVHPGDTLTVRVDRARIEAEICAVDPIGEER